MSGGCIAGRIGRIPSERRETHGALDQAPSPAKDGLPDDHRAGPRPRAPVVTGSRRRVCADPAPDAFPCTTVAARNGGARFGGADRALAGIRRTVEHLGARAARPLFLPRASLEDGSPERIGVRAWRVPAHALEAAGELAAAAGTRRTIREPSRGDLDADAPAARVAACRVSADRTRGPTPRAGEPRVEGHRC